MSSLVLALTTMIGGTASALDSARLPTQHIQDAWSEREGLPQNSVKGITQTRDGLLWLGTEEGLVRFDGMAFRVFDRTTSTGRKTNAVYAVAVDPGSGDLILLGGRDGLCTFHDPDFTCEPLPENASGSALRFDHDNKTLYIPTDRGLFKRTAVGEGKSKTLARVEAFGTATVRDVAFDSDSHTLFVVTAKESALVVGDRKTAIDLGADLTPEDINVVTRLRDGAVWFGTRHGPRLLDESRTRLLRAPFDHGNDNPNANANANANAGANGSVNLILGDRDGTVWISIFNDGLYRTRGRDVLVRVPLALGQAAERIDAAFEDDEGNVWIGSRLSGLHRIRDGAFIPWGAPEGISHGFIHAVAAHANGDVLVAAASGGLYIIRGDRVLHPGRAEGIPEAGVDALVPGRDGTMLLGTRAGLFRLVSFDPVRVEPIAKALGFEVSSALEDEGAAGAATGPHQGDLWIGTSKGLVETKSGKTYGLAEGLPTLAIGPLLRARDGALWIVTDGGVARMRGPENKIDLPLTAPLGRVGTASLLERPDGSIVVGTLDTGVILIPTGGGEPRVLDRAKGLYDNTVHALVDGGDGRLWMSCNKGVFATTFAEIDAWSAKRREKIGSRVWGRESGMRSRECNGGVPAATRDARGRLWFATMQGAVAIDPSKMREPAPPRAPVLESVRVGSSQTMTRPARVSLPADARALVVAFTAPALSGVAPTFDVRLVGGADSEWHATSGRTASFASFGPGSYAIEVRTRDVGGGGGGEGDRTSANVARLLVEVPARFVETNTFRGLVALFAGSFIFAIGIFRVRSVERARRRLARIVEERTSELAARNVELEQRTKELDAALEELKRAETDLVRAEKMASIATLVRGIAHELNNPLAFVTGNVAPLRKYVEFLIAAIHNVASGAKSIGDLRLSPKKDLAFIERDLPKLLADMEEGGRRAKLIVGDLQSLTTATSRSVEPIDVARIIEQSVRLLAPSKPEGVTVMVDVDATLGSTKESEPFLARAGEIEQAIVVLVDNALRAVGPHGKIGVRLTAEVSGDDDKARIITVEDDGPGMTEDVLRRATEPFFTTRAPGEGSGLGLAIASQIAGHHRGSLTIESTPGKGTIVRLTVRNVRNVT